MIEGMENQPNNEQVKNPIFDKVAGVLGNAKEMVVASAKGISEIVMNIIATRINEQDPQSAHDATRYVY